MAATESSATLPPVKGSASELSLDEVLDAIAKAHDGLLDTEEAVVALRHAKEEIETLKEALRTRTVIGQAVGLLMCESTITADEAFVRLVQTSSHTNTKLREIARRMVARADDKAIGGQHLFPKSAS